MLACLVAGLGGLAGCYGTSGGVAYSSTGSYYGGGGYGPDLVAVDTGVSVIPNYDVPIFYSGGYYWRPYNNYWYRSPYYDRGWAYVSRPPRAIARIDRPYRYSHYRPHGYVSRRAYRGDYSRPVYRGGYSRPQYRGGYSRPVYRGGYSQPVNRGYSRPVYRNAPQRGYSRPIYRNVPQQQYRGSARPPTYRSPMMRNRDNRMQYQRHYQRR